jgi:hypothetical protein
LTYSKALSERLSLKSITLCKDTQGLLPLKGPRARVILAGDPKYFASSPLPSFDGAEGKDDLLIVAIFTSVAAWRGSSGIGDDERDRLNSIIGKAGRSVVISFGSPYVLRHFDNADVLIAAYEPTAQAQQAVLACLTGKAPFTGRLPVKIPESQV